MTEEKKKTCFVLHNGRMLLVSFAAMGMLATANQTLAAEVNETMPAVEQQQSVKGQVVDENGEPLIGVTVRVANEPNKATITDTDGNFTLNVAPGTKLLLTYTGYEQLTVTAQHSQKTYQMKPDMMGLDDVVVIGYGTMKKLHYL